MLLTCPGLYCVLCMRGSKRSTTSHNNTFKQICLCPQGGLHLSVCHDAGPCLHRKTPTQKPWIPTKDLLLWPLPDLHGMCVRFKGPPKCASVIFSMFSTCLRMDVHNSVFFGGGRGLYCRFLRLMSHLSHLIRWLPASTCTTKERKKRFSTTSGERPGSWTSRLSTTWRWTSWTPL